MTALQPREQAKLLRSAAKRVEDHPVIDAAELLRTWADALDPQMPAEPFGDVVVRDCRDGLWVRASDAFAWRLTHLSGTVLDKSWHQLWDEFGPLTIFEPREGR